ncbi:MAG: beta strand repeat-containing protein, partial [Sphingomicrobium sp.]
MTASVPVAYRIPRRIHTIRRSALGTTASLAIAIALLNPAPAEAQFAGTAGTSSGVTTGTLGTDTIQVTNSTATINWTANAGNDFLPDGTTQNFTSTSGLDDYTVLNTVTPSGTGPIYLNGTIASTIGGTLTKGGNIWIYSPGGIVIGATAVFDVGGLLLTSLTIANGWSADGDGFSASFSKEAGDGGTIQILAGADIQALQQNSYIALVAPRIEQGGTIRVDGSAALVAAEQLTMTMNQGLFDILVDSGGGTDDPNGIVHTGSTTGPTTGDNIYMVAVPKNLAMTMLLGGTIGFDATSATELNGQIVLSAGWAPYYEGSNLIFQAFSPSTKNANIDIGPGTYTSNVIAIATQNVSAIADTGTINLAGDIIFQSSFGEVRLEASDGNSILVGDFAGLYATDYQDDSGGTVIVEANSGGTIDIGGNLYVDTGVFAQNGGTAQGGDIDIVADGGTINVDGEMTLLANAGHAAAATTDSFADVSYGGSIDIGATNDGAINTGGMFLSANGAGQDGSGGASNTGGTGYGGNITINADLGGAINVDGNLWAQASGFGGNMQGTAILGGYGQGGNIYMSVGDGTIGITGNVNLYAEGFGGWIDGSGSGGTQTGGNGRGGYAYLYSSGPGTITVGGSTDVVANGYGGDGQAGGDGYGGTASIYAEDGTINLGSWNYVAAIGHGGDATFGFGGDGGFGLGGYASIEARANPIVELLVPPAGTITGGDAIVDASGSGGDGGAGNGDDIAAGAGGNGYGGASCSECSGGAFVTAQVDGAALDLGSVGVLSEGIGGAGGTGGGSQSDGAGGNGYGGTSWVGFVDPYATGALTGSMAFNTLEIRARGLGGDGGEGGDGEGGDATLDVDGNALTVDGFASVVANAQGGAASSGTGGSAYGGTALVNILDGGTLTADTLNIVALAFGGDGANGGSASGGSATLIMNDGTATFSEFSGPNLHTYAYGGNASTGTGGNAFGGQTVLDLNGTSSLTGQAIFATAHATGGSGVNGGDGNGGYVELGVWGNASVILNGNNVTNLSADGQGGAGTIAGVGGDGFGGEVNLFVGGDGASLSVADGSFDNDSLLLARGFGGVGGTGGDGFGGAIEISIGDAGGSLTLNGATRVIARGIGGDGIDNAAGTGGAGGDGYGGTVQLNTQPVLNEGATAELQIGDLVLIAGGDGGLGGNGLIGGAGGNGYGGEVYVDIGDVDAMFGDVLGQAIGSGGDGGNGSSGVGGDGG